MNEEHTSVKDMKLATINKPEPSQLAGSVIVMVH